MAGTLLGIPLTPNNDVNGRPLVGCLLRIYEAGGVVEVTAYSDFALTTELPWPIVGNALGRIPMFWLPNSDGETYRARLSSSNGGVICFDEDDLPAIGPAEEDAEEEPGEATNGFQTGDVKWQPFSASQTGWVRANARTIGSVSSGATERPNADCEDLFLYLWTNASDVVCPVGGGRGATAAADWAANKVIGLPDLRARMAIGADGMGGSSTSRLTAASMVVGSATSSGGTGGAETVVLDTTMIPSHTHTFSATSSEDGAHAHTSIQVSGSSADGGASGAYIITAPNEPIGLQTNAATTDTSDTHTHTVSGTSETSGGGLRHANMPPFMTGTWYIKL